MVSFYLFLRVRKKTLFEGTLSKKRHTYSLRKEGTLRAKHSQKRKDVGTLKGYLSRIVIMVIQLLRVYYTLFAKCFARDTRRDNNSNHGYTIIAQIYYTLLYPVRNTLQIRDNKI